MNDSCVDYFSPVRSTLGSNIVVSKPICGHPPGFSYGHGALLWFSLQEKTRYQKWCEIQGEDRKHPSLCSDLRGFSIVLFLSGVKGNFFWCTNLVQ